VPSRAQDFAAGGACSAIYPGSAPSLAPKYRRQQTFETLRTRWVLREPRPTKPYIPRLGTLLGPKYRRRQTFETFRTRWVLREPRPTTRYSPARHALGPVNTGGSRRLKPFERGGFFWSLALPSHIPRLGTLFGPLNTSGVRRWKPFEHGGFFGSLALPSWQLVVINPHAIFASGRNP